MNYFINKKQAVFYYDYLLIIIVSSLLTIGFILLTSASLGISEKWYHNPLHFILHQTFYLIIGITATLTIKRISLGIYEKFSGYLLILSVFFLIIVLLPGIGHQVNGSTRWIRLFVISIQVSEFTKSAMVIYMASYLSRKQDEVRISIKGFLKPLILLAMISFLLILEPDFGAMVIVILTILGMMYLAGARLWQFLVLLVLIGIAIGILAIISPYRLIRLTSFLNPWEKPFDSGYQLIQSLIAFGRGGIFGVGLGNGVQKLFYLPEVHTDFLFAVLAEEFGIFGQMIVIGLFSSLVGRSFYLGQMAMKIKNYFSGYLAYGFGLLLGLQMIINIGVNIGLLPTKGLTLPFMSYGGSSMIFNCIIFAILLRIFHEIKLNKTINFM